MTLSKRIYTEESTYIEILNLIEKGFYEEASQKLRVHRKNADMPQSRNQFESHNDWNLLSMLLSFRLTLHSGILPKSFINIQIETISNLYIKGEFYFVNGLYLFHINKMQEGAIYFFYAAEIFKQIAKNDRFYVSQYNYIIGKSYEPNISTHWLLTEIRKLEEELQSNPTQHQKILGVCLRQKSYLYKDLKHFQAAFDEGLKSAQLLEIYGSQSDYQLSLINLCEISLEQTNLDNAKLYLQKIIPPMDPRVQFPYHFFKHRTFNVPLNLEMLNHSCPHFLERFNIWKKSHKIKFRNTKNEPQTQNNWNALTGELTLNQEVIKFKQASLEFKLLQSIHKGPISKELLCERLWPEYSQIHLLDNRLHRLISRLNKKTNGLIEFKNGSYHFSLLF